MMTDTNVLNYKKRMKIKKTTKSVIMHSLLILMAIFWLIPIFWLLGSAFNIEKGINISNFFPTEFTFINFVNLFTNIDSVNRFPIWFKNTLIVAIFTCLISTTFVLAVAYTTSRLRFKGRKTMMNIGILIGLFPGALSMIAVYFILKAMGLTGTLTALVLVYSASAGLGYLIAKGFFDTIPKTLDEAAKIDGATQFDIFLKIILPLSKPIIVYTVLMSFLAPWVDFFFARIIIPPTEANNLTVAVGLFNMLDRSLINSYFSTFAAGAVVVSIPIATLFIFMQRYYVEGVTGGSVKG